MKLRDLVKISADKNKIFLVTLINIIYFVSRSGFENYYRLFVDRMERIRKKDIFEQWKRMERSKSSKKKEFFGWTYRISQAFYSNKYRIRIDGFMSFTSFFSLIETDYSNRWREINELGY